MRDDSSVVAVVAVVLLLAVATTVYAEQVTTAVPRWGADAERQWDEQIAIAMSNLARAAGNGVGVDSPVSVTIAPPPIPRSLDVPLIGKATPAQPSGALSFEPACSSLTATHTRTGASATKDVVGGANGCLVFRTTTSYTSAASHRVEFGGVLRAQQGRAVVIGGPPLELGKVSDNDYRATLVVPALRGPALSYASDDSAVRIDLVLGPSAPEISPVLNAGSAKWTFTSPYPEAWKTWFDERLSGAGWVASRPSPGPGQSSADYTVACVPASCAVGAGGTGDVVVTLNGPRTDRDDLRVSISYGVYDVAIR